MPQLSSDGGAEEGMSNTEQGGSAEGPAEVAIGDEIDVMKGRAATPEKKRARHTIEGATSVDKLRREVPWVMRDTCFITVWKHEI